MKSYCGSSCLPAKGRHSIAAQHSKQSSGRKSTSNNIEYVLVCYVTGFQEGRGGVTRRTARAEAMQLETALKDPAMLARIDDDAMPCTPWEHRAYKLHYLIHEVEPFNQWGLQYHAVA